MHFSDLRLIEYRNPTTCLVDGEDFEYESDCDSSKEEGVQNMQVPMDTKDGYASCRKAGDAVGHAPW